MGRPRKEPLSELEKIAKKIGPDAEDILKELEAMAVPELDKRIAQANQSISETKAELDENEKYQELKESLKAVTAGFREVKGRQNAIIAICVKLRKDQGAT